MMRSKWFFLMVATLAAASLWGCGSNGGSGGSAVTPTDSQPQAVGSDSCIVCHGNNVAFVLADWTTSIHNTEGVGCENCHGNGGAHRGVGPIPYPSPSLEGQCAVCHTDEASLARHAGDDPATATVVEGYVMRDVEPEGCRDCHGDAHDVVAGGINEQWAQSGHAGRIATDAPDTETVWGYYDWDSASRASCARCHTTTGIMNFLNAPGTYAAANNDFSHLEEGQNELLYCWGCHSNTGTGELRNPGAITEAYAGYPTGSPAVTVGYPDSGKSNVCMGCHLGREVGGVIAASTGDFSNLSFINSHYLAAGGMIYGEAGYEFASMDYTGWEDGQKYGRHGNVARDEFGEDGPCVTCHMTSAEPHKFEVVQKDAAGVITAVATTACDSCHGNMNAAWLEERKETFHEALEALNQALLAKGIEFKPSHPYFYVPGTTTAFKNWEGVYPGKGKDVMGAAFNYNLLEHDPGAYAHNRPYALKLIVDSIDFLADGLIDGNGTFTINALPVDLLAQAMAVEEVTIDARHHDGSFDGNAMYVAQNASCGDCHAANPVAGASRFVTNGAIIDQFAESGHGDVTGAAWRTSASHDWPNTGCNVCHSTSGFIAVAGGTPDPTVVQDAGQVLACDACHTSVATGEVRPRTQVVAGYKSQTLSGTTWTLDFATFPDVAAQNNICISCHSGRESGESIKALADLGMNNVSFKNPHYLGAAGMMYAKLGYNFAGQDDLIPGTTTTYGKSLTANEDGGSLTSTHRKLGTAAINGDRHSPLFVAGFLDSDGPCVTCHMGDVEDHTWEINANAFNNVCVVCHDEEAGTPLTADNFEELFIEEQAIPFEDAIALAEAKLFANFNIKYTENYPYFYDYSLATPAAVKDWTRGGTLTAAQAKNLMGAALNIKLMHADPAAYVHSRTYARRLLYDTIDWLDDKTLNLSTGATALAWDSEKYVKDATAGGTTTESAKYLMKYDRTSLAWDTASERP
jgi:hypothetical protein